MDVAARYRKALPQAGFGRLDAAEAVLREVLAAAEPGSVAPRGARRPAGGGRVPEAVPLLDSALAAPWFGDLLDVERDRARAPRADHG